MSEELWVVRAGEQAKYVREFESNSYIAIGFHQLASDDLSLTDEETVKGRVTSPAERTYAGQLVAFAYRMQVGDLVIVPRLTRKHRDYLVARITGPYRHIAVPPASGHHQRQVQWLGTFSRGSLSPSAINTLGAILTLFRPAAVDAELRGLLTALTPIGPGLATPAHGVTRKNIWSRWSSAAPPATSGTSGRSRARRRTRRTRSRTSCTGGSAPGRCRWPRRSSGSPPTGPPPPAERPPPGTGLAPGFADDGSLPKPASATYWRRTPWGAGKNAVTSHKRGAGGSRPGGGKPVTAPTAPSSHQRFRSK